MSTTPRLLCDTCDWYVPISGTNPAQGECRRYPPYAQSTVTTPARWPRVQGVWWCGEFQQAKNRTVTSL